MKLRTAERELLEIELLTWLIVQAEAAGASDFQSRHANAALMDTVREAKQLLGLEDIPAPEGKSL